MALPWRDLDPRRWSRGLWALAVLFVATVAALALLAPAGVARWDAYRADRRFDAVALPRVAAALPPASDVGVRVLVTRDTVDLDFRPRLAAMPEPLRRRLWRETDPLWRDALLVESRGLVSLHGGGVGDDDAHRLVRAAIEERATMSDHNLNRVDADALEPFRRRTTLLFIDRDVPMATVADVFRGTLTSERAVALRGPHGVVALPFPVSGCAPNPSVEVRVSTARFALRSTTERRGCVRGRPPPAPLAMRETVIDRAGPDRGLRALHAALLAAPWALPARTGPSPDDEFASLIDPWGFIQLTLDAALPFGDFVAVAMAARELTPGSCHLSPGSAPGCLFPYLSVGVPAVTPTAPALRSP